MMLALEGIRVLDWTQWQQGPVASMMLADLGADVIKIEDPIRGDAARGAARISGQITYKSGRNSYFETNNRNKRGITLNLKDERGRDIFYQLIEKSDVFLHNFLPGVVDRLQLDYEHVKERNPLIIYAVASAFGPRGPESDTPAFDLIGLARSGIMTVAGEANMPPLKIEGGIADQLGGMVMAYGIVVALLARDRRGVGQRVDASLLGSMMFMQGLNVSMKLIDGGMRSRQYRAKAANVLYNHYRCSDGKWLALAHLQADRFWPIFCKAMGIERLLDDPKYATAVARSEYAEELTKLADDLFAHGPRAEWLAHLREHGLIVSPVADFDDVVADPTAIANDYVISYEHPVWGPVQSLGFPIALSETAPAIRRCAPEFGEHTEEILSEILGYDWDEIVQLRSDGVI